MFKYLLNDKLKAIRKNHAQKLDFLLDTKEVKYIEYIYLHALERRLFDLQTVDLIKEYSRKNQN